MNKLERIYYKSQEIINRDLSPLDKIILLLELQGEASRETWCIDKEYSKNANDLYLYVQSLWNNLYFDYLSEEEQKEADKYIYKGLDKNWSIK